MIELFTQVYKLVLFKMEHTSENGQPAMDDIKNVLLEYQKQTAVIENQLQMCKKDHEILRRNSAEVVEENRRLLKQLKDKCENESETQTVIRLEESLIIRNLQQQLSFTANERDILKEMWLLSAKTLEDLQSEFHHYKEEMENKTLVKQIESLKRDYSDAISLLEMKLADIKADQEKQKEQYVKLENKKEQLKKEVDIIMEEKQALESKLGNLTAHNEELKEKCFTLETKCVYFESLTGCKNLQRNIDKEDNDSILQTIKTERNELQKALENCHKTIEVLSNQASAGKDKVEEAVRLLEDAEIDRHQAEARAAQAEEECRRLQLEIKGLIEEAGLQVSREVATCKEQHSRELVAVQMDLKIAKQDAANKCEEIKKLVEECKRLEILIMQKNCMHQEPAKLEKKLEKFYSHLHASEEKSFQIFSENEALTKSYESLHERHSRCKLEKVMYQKQIFLMEEQIESLTKELEETTRKAETLAVEVQNLNLQSSHEIRNGSDKLLLRLQEIQDKNMAATKELHRHVEAHNDLARKWKSEMLDLTDRFESKLKKVKSDRKKEKKKIQQILCSRSKSELQNTRSSGNIDENNKL